MEITKEMIDVHAFAIWCEANQFHGTAQVLRNWLVKLAADAKAAA